jgi:hypothetical protein
MFAPASCLRSPSTDGAPDSIWDRVERISFEAASKKSGPRLLLGPQGWSDSNIDSGSAASLHVPVRREIQKIRS